MAIDADLPPMGELRQRIQRLPPTVPHIWVHYLSVGCDPIDELELDAYLAEALIASPRMHAMIAHTVWELEHFNDNEP